MTRFSLQPAHRRVQILAVSLLLAASGFSGLARAEKPADFATLGVVSDDNYPPYIFRDASGKLRGILPDQWALWEQKTGVKVDLQAMDWAEAQRFMREGRADVIDTIFFTEERAKLYDFAPAYAQIEVPVYAHKSLGGIVDISSLKGFTIGVKAGDAVTDYLTKRGIDSLKDYPSYEALILAAKNQEIKVFSVDQPAAEYYLYKHGVSDQFRQSVVLYTGEFHRAVLKNRPDLLHLVQEGFSKISRREYRAIERKWMGAPLQLKQLLRQSGPWLLGVVIVILALAAVNFILGRRVRAKTAELRTALDDLRQSLAALKKTEMALRDNQELFLQFMRHSPIYIFIKEVTDTESRVLMASENFKQMIGIPGSEMLGKTMEELFSPEFAAKMSADDRAVVSKGEVLKLEEELNGRHYTTIKFPIVKEGKTLLAGYTIDITDRMRAEDEKAALQEQLAQAQKLESIGRLAGGVAHDFNNMLQAILGYTELALEQVSSGQPLHDDLIEIHKSALRSANLTRQLLTFARKQAVAPMLLNINLAVMNMFDMLRRLIGEDIHLEWRPGPNLGTVMMDPGQFDQVVINLCLNARDAVDKSGHIVIETANVEIAQGETLQLAGIAPGAYVKLAICDDGQGMPPDIRDRVFEPFFTTKPLGQGTGLGLASVYGIVKQSGGTIRVDSEPGKGSVFQIYLPRCDGKYATPAQEPPIDATRKHPG